MQAVAEQLEISEADYGHQECELEDLRKMSQRAQVEEPKRASKDSQRPKSEEACSYNRGVA